MERYVPLTLGLCGSYLTLMKLEKNPSSFAGMVAAFYAVGAIGGGGVGLIEAIARHHLTKGNLVSPLIDSLLSGLLFAGFYSGIFGAVGIIAGVAFFFFRPTETRIENGGAAASIFLVAVAAMYLSVPINRRLPPIGTPASLIGNALFILWALALTYALAVLAGRLLDRVAAPVQKRPNRFAIVGLVILLAGTVSWWVHARPTDRISMPEGSANGPNVLLVSIDTLRADHLPAYGYPHIQTPTINALANSGTLFEQAFSTTSWTLPACATLITGRTPRALGMHTPADALPRKAATIAEAMKKSGRVTAAVISNPFLSSDYGFDRGFDRFVDVFDPSIRPALSGIYLFDHLFRLRFSLDDAANVTGRALDQLKALKNRPFFLWVHYMDPHKPYGGPWVTKLPEYTAGYEGSITFVYGWREPVNKIGSPLSEQDLLRVQALYDADIKRVDHFLGKLLRKLSSLGIAENTVIALVSDHGEEFLEHGDFGHGTNLFAEQTHVPLILAGPGIPRNRRVASRASIVDLPRTLCEVAGVPAPDTFQGESLMQLIDSSQPHDVFAELVRPDKDPHLVSLRYGNGAGSLVVFNMEDQSTGLYDRTQDPGELENVYQFDPLALYSGLNLLDLAQQQQDRAGVMVWEETRPKLSPESAERLRTLGYIVQ
jgi:arylsulfatase A-like enzyme